MNTHNNRYAKWKQRELVLILLYAIAFYAYVVWRSLRLSHGISSFCTNQSILKSCDCDLVWL